MSAVLEQHTAVANVPKRQSLVEKFAARYAIDADKLLPILKATAFKVKDGEVTNEQMAALLIVADQYQLNPFTREIFAFPDKQNGIVPVVSVDGWARIINEQPQMNGLEFTYSDAMIKVSDSRLLGLKHDANEWMECTIFRKDREHPTVVREYLDEVYRKPFTKGDYVVESAWQTHTRRFHRHKTLIQCARLAFGFAGIYDEDEAQRIIEGDASPARETSPAISSLNQAISRGKTTIEGESHRVAAEPKQSATAGVAVPGAAAVAERAGGVAPPASDHDQEQMTVIDAIAKLASFSDADKMAEWTGGNVPMPVRQDDRFAKAYRARIDELKDGAKKK